MTASVTKPAVGQGPGWGVLINAALDALVTEVNAHETLAATTYAPQLVVPTAQTSSYTYVLADAGTTVDYNSASPGNLTVPANATAAFPIGTVISGRQLGTGLATIVAAGSVTINSLGGALKSSGQYAAWKLQKLATNTWILTGSIST